jgi:ribosome maturation factor RimP
VYTQVEGERLEWAKAHFFIACLLQDRGKTAARRRDGMADRTAVVEKVREIVERVGASEGVEIVDVQLLGGGNSRVLRIFIDKPQGVTHADCEFMSQNAGTILDVEDVIPGGHYTLEVSSPGVERKLTRAADFERFSGQKIKVVLREAVDGQKHWAGTLKSCVEGIVILEPAPGRSVQFPLEQVEKANLKFEW